MVRFALALCMAALLGGCLPFALFASSGDSYKGYKQSWGTYVSHSNVDAFCLTPKLRLAIAEFEGHFGRKIVMNSGYRDAEYNSRVGGASSSYHTKCMAADFFIPGVDKRKLLAYAAKLKVVGGLGCYPNRNFIHIDVRDRPAGWNKPVIFNC